MYEGKHIHYSEVDRKPLCSYSPKLCKQRRLNGYAFCIRHVLEDRTAPFRQCEYVAKYNSQRCTTPIPKTQDRKYCSSHLQVMGVLPKKERKKKHDTLDSLALNITVPSLALKATNGLDHLTPSSPFSHTCLLPLDPYAYCKGETVRKESISLGKKPPSRLSPNHKQRHVAPAIAPLSSSPRCPTTSSQQAEGPMQVSTATTSPPTPMSQLLRSSSGTLCTTSAQTDHQILAKPTNPIPEMCQEPALDKRVLSTQPGKNDVHGHPVMRPSNPRQHQAPFLVQLQRLMAQQRRRHEDLNPHFGLDWSEESGGEEDDQVEQVVSYQHHHLQEKRSLESAGGGGSRGERLAGLCSYLRQRHKLLRREERGLRRERRSGHDLRKALLQAASQDPTHAAQLIQQRHTPVSATASTAGSWVGGSDSGLCVAQINGQACTNCSLPFTRHCFQHILQNRSQQLFSSCTARFADGAQCSVPVFDITHQTPLCEEHAKKMDNFLRGDVSRRTYHHQQQLQQRRRLKKAKLPALGKKQKKKSRRGVIRRPQKPIPPALPQGNLGMPSILCQPAQPGGIRSPLTPDLSADELPDDLTSDISDIPHDLELNQEDFSDVLPRFPDDLQDFDLFEGKTSELLPTSEEAEELERVLQAMGSYPESLACLSGMADLGPVEGSDCRGMEGGVVDLLSARLSAETLSNLELDPSLLRATEDTFSPSPPSPQPPLTPPSSVGHLTDALSTHRQHSSLLAKTGDPKEDLGNLSLGRDEDISHGSWGVLALPLSDSAQFHNLIASDGLLMSTALSTPLTPMPSAPCQPTALSALPESSLTTSSSSSSPRADLLCPSQLKHPLPPLFNHCGIPADLQPHHSAPAPTMDQT
ncbi:INO80 complex subunit D-B isoform X2 [Pygocentrus nattereri]|uniref:KANL2-like probable zinc-finger domain-containing protein n=1 Tax=Pygocentrus nattereri TaxID=42514 RepID=A0A3B4BVG8_PYGNA|nr:INO80 complex subunit D-B isoform X2 [Pygocentrus nattereri]